MKRMSGWFVTLMFGAALCFGSAVYAYKDGDVNLSTFGTIVGVMCAMLAVYEAVDSHNERKGEK